MRQTFESIAKEKGKECEANVAKAQPSSFSNKNRKRRRRLEEVENLSETLSPRRTRALTIRKALGKISPKENVSTAV